MKKTVGLKKMRKNNSSSLLLGDIMNDIEFARRLVEITRRNMTDEEKEDERVFNIACDVFDNEIGAYGRNMHPKDFLKLSKEEQDKMIIHQWDDCVVEMELVERVRQLLIAEFIE